MGGFESPVATISKCGHFRSLYNARINEYLGIYSVGNVSDLVLARNYCSMARMLPGEAELVSE